MGDATEIIGRLPQTEQLRRNRFMFLVCAHRQAELWLIDMARQTVEAAAFQKEKLPAQLEHLRRAVLSEALAADQLKAHKGARRG